MNTKELGDLGERIACEYLVKKGYKIIEKNFRIKWGEIDIIAKKKFTLLNKIFQILIFVKQKLFNGAEPSLLQNNKTIHFVEVKTIVGNQNNFFPEDHVDYKKQRKLQQLCQIWLANNKFPKDYPHQIDIAGVILDETTNKATIRYFPNIAEDKY